jgi:curved DNA-binding protein CbpA
MKDFREQNFYELLEIPVHATREEVEQAYRRSLEIFNPDSVAVYALFSPEELAALRRRLDEAYDTLGNLDRRRKYDLDLGLRRPDSTPPPISPPSASTPEPPSPTPVPEVASPQASPQPTTPVVQKEEAAPPALAAEPRPSAPPPEALPPPPAIGPETVVDGSLLKQLRQARGLSLEKLSEMTKINIYYLRQLEENHYDKLPEAVYVRGYLRLLAGAFKVNSQLLVEGYTKNLKKNG